MRIYLQNESCSKSPLSLAEIRGLYRAAKCTLQTENLKRKPAAIPASLECSLTLVGDARIADLNRCFRQIERPTDVLSFPLYETKEPILPHTSLGDIVISLDTLERQAIAYGHSRRRELCFLFVHGLLHLLGYDHEISPAEEKLQFIRQEEILEQLGIVR